MFLVITPTPTCPSTTRLTERLHKKDIPTSSETRSNTKNIKKDNNPYVRTLEKEVSEGNIGQTVPKELQ